MHRLLWAGLLLTASCASTSAADRSTTSSSTRAAQDRAAKRQQRMAVRDLEHQVAQLKAKLGASRHASAPVAPALPVVEVHEPSEPQPQEPDVVVAGYDEDGAEILYVGEAASGETYVPTIRLSGTGSRVATQPAAAPKRRPAKSLPAVPITTDSLAAHGRIGPRVSELGRRAPVAEPSPDPVDPKDIYKEAYKVLREGQAERAMAMFREFLARHPSHEYADNAQYWLGESYYARSDYASAVAEFHKVIQNYPKGNKVPAAKLKIAYCHVALGHAARAKALLKKLVDEHPTSAPARLAGEKLKTL